MQYYLAIKKEQMIHAATDEAQKYLLSEKSKTQKNYML